MVKSRTGAISAEWARYKTFLKRPKVTGDALPPSASGLAAVFRMLGLDLIVMIVLLGLVGLAIASGFEPPSNQLDGIELDMRMVLLIVLVAPVLEEIFFRGWLSGKLSHVLAVIALLGVFATGAAGAVSGGESGSVPVAPLAALVLLALAAFALWHFRKRKPMGWFARLFPVFFWLSSIGFALIHLLNYTEGSLAMLLPLVLPQFAIGTMLGYVRVNYGLWASMLLHALHNATFTALIAFGTLAG